MIVVVGLLNVLWIEGVSVGVGGGRVLVVSVYLDYSILTVLVPLMVVK